MGARAGALALAVALLASCGPREEVPPPNVLLVVVDTLRADRLGAYGSSLGLTPFLDDLARRATLFERAYAPCSWTLPSVASLFTSRQQGQHGVFGFASRLAREEATLAESFRAAGFLTGGLSANPLLFARLGWGQGFDAWQPLGRSGAPGTESYVDAGFLGARALEWLDANRRPGQPSFLYLQYMDPHAPYLAPEPFRSRRVPAGTLDAEIQAANDELLSFGLAPLPPERGALLSALYDAEVAYLDHELRSLFDALRARGFLDHAVVVVTADHGEEFQEHGGSMHGRSLFEEVVRVPLLVLAPGLPAGRRIGQPVSLVDVAPTLLELAGLPPEPRFGGRSLTPLLRGADAQPAPVMLELARNPELRADDRIHASGLVDDGRKLLVGPDGSLSLFELAGDPGERAPADPSAAPEGAELTARLERARAKLGTPARPSEPLDAEQRKLLRALGYLHE
jgi:arylsulfatase A-like enzyme